MIPGPDLEYHIGMCIGSFDCGHHCFDENIHL